MESRTVRIRYAIGGNDAEGKRRLPKPSAGQVPRKLFKIGEVMAATGISRQTLHDYTVSGFIEEEERTPAGHRLYAEWIFERLGKMSELQEQGKSLKEIKQLIDEGKL